MVKDKDKNLVLRHHAIDRNGHKPATSRPRLRPQRRKKRRAPWRQQALAAAVGLLIGGIFLVLYRLTWSWFLLRYGRSSNMSSSHRKGSTKAALQHWKDFVEDPLTHKDKDSRKTIEELFDMERHDGDKDTVKEILHTWLDQLNTQIIRNHAGGLRWIRPYLLPDVEPLSGKKNGRMNKKNPFFFISRDDVRMKWEDEWDGLSEADKERGPAVDYRDEAKYIYPPLLDAPPTNGEYPPLRDLSAMMRQWPQTEDYAGTIEEALLR